MSRNIHILHIHLGSYDYSEPHKLALHNIATNVRVFHYLKFFVYEYHFVQTHYTTKFSPRSPDEVDYYISVVQAKLQTWEHVIIQ